MKDQARFSFPLLDLTRGLAALWVLICHVTLVMGERVFLISQGGIAVDVFIVVSGLLMYAIVAGEKSMSWRVASQFYVRRLLRIAPVFYVAILVFVVGRHFYHTGLMEIEGIFDNYKYKISELSEPEIHWWDILASIFFVHGINTWQSVKIVAPAWSLSLEMQFYMVAPFLLYFFKRKPWLALAVAFAVNWIGGLLLGVNLTPGLIKDVHYIHPSFLPHRLFLFMLGAACCRCLMDMNRKELLVLAGAVFGSAVLFEGKHMMICLPMVAFFVLVRRFPEWPVIKWVENLSRTKPVYWMAELSYSVYLMHMFWVVVALHVLRPWLPQSGADRGDFWLFLIVASVISIAMAVPMFLLVERPLREWGRGFAKRLFKKPDAHKNPATAEMTSA